MMKTTVIAGTIVLSVIFTATGTAQTSETSKKQKNEVVSTQQAADVYVCPMHPEVTATAAGTCSKCGMALEKRSTKEDAVQSTGHKKEMKKSGDKKGCCAEGCGMRCGDK